MTNISQFPRGLAPSHLLVLAHICAMYHKANIKWSKKPYNTLVRVCRLGNLISNSHHQTLQKPEARPASSSYCNFNPCWDFAFSGASVLFVQLKNSSYSGLSFSTQISTDQATGAVILISQLQFQPYLPHPLPSRSCQSPVTMCLLTV